MLYLSGPSCSLFGPGCSQVGFLTLAVTADGGAYIRIAAIASWTATNSK